MPYRKTIFANNYFYHVLNRGFSKKIIFRDKIDYQRALQTINFYRFPNPSRKFSSFVRLPTEKDKQIFLKNLYRKKPLVEIISYCLMPNHSHFLLKQISDKGVSLFMSNWQNSFARYFNNKYQKKGSLLDSRFKAKLIENESVLWHVSRYIHLNPSSASLTDVKNLNKYAWSSLPVYLGEKEPLFTTTNLILSHFS